MQRLYHDETIPDAFRGAVLALGNFDGFHLGHQAVVNRAIALGFHMRRPVIVATFDPHPVSYFKPDVPPFRLTTLDQRQELFAHAGADAMLVFRFGPDVLLWLLFVEVAFDGVENTVDEALRVSVGKFLR